MTEIEQAIASLKHFVECRCDEAYTGRGQPPRWFSRLMRLAAPASTRCVKHLRRMVWM